MSRWKSRVQWEADADLMERVLRDTHRRMDAAGIPRGEYWTMFVAPYVRINERKVA